MEAVRHHRYVGVQSVLPDQLHGEREILLGVGRLVLLDEPLRINALGDHHVVHAVRLADLLVTALAAGQHRLGFGVFLQIALRRLNAPVQDHRGIGSLDLCAQHHRRGVRRRCIAARQQNGAGDDRAVEQKNRVAYVDHPKQPPRHGIPLEQTRQRRDAEHQHPAAKRHAGEVADVEQAVFEHRRDKRHQPDGSRNGAEDPACHF